MRPPSSGTRTDTLPVTSRVQPVSVPVSVDVASTDTGAPSTVTDVREDAPASFVVHSSVKAMRRSDLTKRAAAAGISSGRTVPAKDTRSPSTDTVEDPSTTNWPKRRSR